MDAAAVTHLDCPYHAYPACVFVRAYVCIQATCFPAGSISVSNSRYTRLQGYEKLRDTFPSQRPLTSSEGLCVNSPSLAMPSSRSMSLRLRDLRISISLGTRIWFRRKLSPYMLRPISASHSLTLTCTEEHNCLLFLSASITMTGRWTRSWRGGRQRFEHFHVYSFNLKHQRVCVYIYMIYTLLHFVLMCVLLTGTLYSISKAGI